MRKTNKFHWGHYINYMATTSEIAKVIKKQGWSEKLSQPKET
jgi:hypothetical protein